MSFRDNLLHLRSSHNMTQEQLAMLLGVSRQSVTKWEAEKTSPEMDKLLAMCQIFDCTLDELVQGDLTNRQPDPANTLPVTNTPTDICGYEDHSLKIAWKIPTGIAAIILGVALFIAPVAHSINNSSIAPISAAFIFLGIIVGLAFIIPSALENAAFSRSHPFIEDFYTLEDKTKARKRFSFQLVVGIALIFAGICIAAFFDGRGEINEAYGVSILLAFIAVAVWLIVNGGMYLGRTNLKERNLDVVDDLEIEDIMDAPYDDAWKQDMLKHKKHSTRKSAICSIIMLIATIVGLVFLFTNISIMGAPSKEIFRIAWPIGGICCAVAVLVYHLFTDKN